MVKISFELFEAADHRANRLYDAEYRRSPDPSSPRRRLYSNGPKKVLQQLELLGLEVERAPVHSCNGEYRWRVSMPAGYPAGLQSTVKVMQEVLTLAAVDHIDLTLALDWYKKVQDGVDPNNWSNTAAGELNYRSKYYGPGPEKRRARAELVERMCAVIHRHMLLSECDVIMSTPGSAGDGNSHGEQLAEALASKASRSFVKPTSAGPRAQRKAGGADGDPDINLLDTFAGEHVLIVDDVLRTGATMRATALAARLAGAGRVVGLAVARTMRS